MSMLIRQHRRDNVTFLRIEGAMIIDDDRDFLKQRVAELLEARQTNIVLDLENCLWISNLCVLALSWCRQQAQEKGGDCRLVHVDRDASLMLLIKGELDNFRTFRDLDDAVKSYN